MTFFKKTLPIVLLGACFLVAACDQGDGTPDEPWEPPAPTPKDPKIPTMEDCETDEVFASQSKMRLLTRYEYDNTIRDLLGVELELAKQNFPQENAVSGFENNSDSHAASPLLVREMMEASEDLASTALRTRRNRLLPCETEDIACGESFVDDFLPRAFRRPATDEEASIYKTLFADAYGEYGFDDAVEMVVEATLQSPQFLYKLELSEGMSPGGLVQVNSYEMATRLSYMLWSSMPDAKLFEAAAADELQTDEGIRAQVSRMLLDPRAEQGIWHFYRQWLGLDALDTMTKDAETYPEYTPSMIASWKQSIYDYVTWIHDKHPDVQSLLSSNTVFLNNDLAAMYGATPRGESAQFSMKADERAGLLTQPAVMALLAHTDQGSPIHRGIFVREKLLCQKLPPPPDNIQIEPPDPDPNATTREIFSQHSSVEGCAGCHQLIDPIGFGFENYDGVGAYRTTEHGKAVDASGNLFNTADKSMEGEFDGGVELSIRLSGSAEVRDCIADHWITYALGHTEQRADMCSAIRVRDTFAETGSFEDLFVALATADMFRYRTVQVIEEDGQ